MQKLFGRQKRKKKLNVLSNVVIKPVSLIVALVRFNFQQAKIDFKTRDVPLGCLQVACLTGQGRGMCITETQKMC